MFGMFTPGARSEDGKRHHFAAMIAGRNVALYFPVEDIEAFNTARGCPREHFDPIASRTAIMAKTPEIMAGAAEPIELTGYGR